MLVGSGSGQASTQTHDEDNEDSTWTSTSTTAASFFARDTRKMLPGDSCVYQSRIIASPSLAHLPWKGSDCTHQHSPPHGVQERHRQRGIRRDIALKPGDSNARSRLGQSQAMQKLPQAPKGRSKP